MADTSSFMDWEPQTPPQPFNPYQGQYMPGGWPMDPPPLQTTGLFDPPRRRTRTEELLAVLPAAKRLCTDLVRTTFHAATVVVIVPTVAVVRRVRRMRQARAARPARRRATHNQVVAAPPSQPATPVRHIIIQTPTPPATPPQEDRAEVIPLPKKQEDGHATTQGIPLEVPEFRPARFLKKTRGRITPQKTVRRAAHEHAFSCMPKIPPPQGQKPVILATPDQIVAKPLPDAVCVQLQSPFPQLLPEPTNAFSPASPAITATSDETTTPSTQLQGELCAVIPAAHTQRDLQTSTESDSEENTIISSVTNSRKRRSNIQGSTATPDSETSNLKRSRIQGPSAASPITPTPNPVIVVQDIPIAVDVQAPDTSSVDTNLLTPTRFKNRKFSTPKSLRKTLHKKPQTPQADESILSSTCGASPGNYHLDEVGSPAKSEISSFFQGTPPAHPEREANVLRMITAGGGGSPLPAPVNTPKSEETQETTGSNGRGAQLQSSGERSTGNKSAEEETEEETKDDVSPPIEATTEMMERQSGLSNQTAVHESNTVTEANEQASPKDDNESPVAPTEASTATTSTPIDLTDDNDEEEGNPSSTSTTSEPSTPEKQLARLKLYDDKYRTPERPTPKASPHSVERTTRKTRGDAKREQRASEKHLYNIVALSAEWEDKIQHALRHGHKDFTPSDFARVVPPAATNNGTAAWLNDEVINGYLTLIVKHGRETDRPTQVPSFHAFSSFFYNNLVLKGHDSVKRWASRAKIGGKNLLETQAVFIPINTGAHWTLLVVSGKDRSATHYNSMRGNGGPHIKAAKSWLAAELGAHYKEEEWVFVETGESPMQSNMDDCGVFTITSARQIMLGLTPMSYGPEEIPLQRKRIVAELVAGELLKSNV